MQTPHFPRRKASAIANGVFFILLGILLYTDKWWPGILFVILITFGLRQFLSGRVANFLVTVFMIGVFTAINFVEPIFSFIFPLIFIGLGLYFILREFLPMKKPSNP